MLRRKVEEVVVKDDSNDRLHIRYRETVTGKGRAGNDFESERILSDERCQKDQAGSVTELATRGGRADRGDGVPIGTPPENLCGFCFPDDALWPADVE